MQCKCGKKITDEDLENYTENCEGDNINEDGETAGYFCECGREYTFGIDAGNWQRYMKGGVK